MAADSYSEEGRWESLVETVFCRLDDTKTSRRRLQRPRTEREIVELVLVLLKERNCLSLLEEFLESLETPADTKKDDQMATEHREAGNKCFQKKKFIEALTSYNKSIVTAKPASDGGEALSLAYANRSAVFYHLELYKECKNDIEKAMQTGYPDNLRYKLLQRKGQCYLCEGELELAAKAFKSSIELCTKFGNDPQKKEILEKLLRNCTCKGPSYSKHSATPSSQDNADAGGGKFAESQLLYNASKAVSLKYNGTQGRYLVANETIKPGDIVIQEKPYSCVLLPPYYETCCYHCTQSTLAPIPCCACPHVIYCSMECQHESWKSYHYIECPLWSFLSQVSDFSHLSFRILLKAGWSNIQKYTKEVSNPDPVPAFHIPGCDTNGHYKSDYHSVYSLLTHSDKQPWKDVFSFTLTSIILSTMVTKLISLPDDVSNLTTVTEEMKITDSLNAAEESKDLSLEDESSLVSHKSQPPGDAAIEQTKDSTDSGQNGINESDGNKCAAAEHKLSLSDAEIAVASVLLHHLLQLRCNMHAVTVVEINREDGAAIEGVEQIVIASALYGTTSLLNNSCDPNVFPAHHGNQLTVRATKKILKGEAIVCRYGPYLRLMSRKERFTYLWENYYFTCKCSACQSTVEEQSPAECLLCKKCGHMACITCTIYAQCLSIKCRYQWNVVETLKVVENSRQLFHVATTLLAENKIKECLTTLHKTYKLQKSVLYKHNKELAETEDFLTRCYSMLMNYSKAAKYLKLSIETYSIIYGEDSIEIGNELFKLAVLLGNCLKANETLGVIDRSMKILSRHLGDNHSDVQQLLEMKTILISLKDRKFLSEDC